MQSKNFKKSYLLNLLQTIDNDEYNLKANKGKKTYNPAEPKKGIKYNPKTDLKSGKRFIPQNLPDYSTSEQKLHKTDKTLYARNVLKGHIEPEYINDIISMININELNYLYNSGPYIVRQLDKNFNKSAITPEIFVEYLQSLYNKQNLNVDETDKEDDEDNGSEPDLSNTPYLTDYDLLQAFEEATQENAEAMGDLEEKEAEEEGHYEALQAPHVEPIKASPKKQQQKNELETSFSESPIKSLKEFNKYKFSKLDKQAILDESYDELSPYFSYLGMPIEQKQVFKLKVPDLNKGFKKFFE